MSESDTGISSSASKSGSIGKPANNLWAVHSMNFIDKVEEVADGQQIAHDAN